MTLHILSILLKNLSRQDVQTGVLWILQLNQFKRLERLIRCMNHKDVPLLLPQQFLNDLNNMLNTNIKDAPNFIRILISSIKKSYLKITHELLSTKLCDSPPDFISSIYYSHRSYYPILYYLIYVK